MAMQSVQQPAAINQSQNARLSTLCLDLGTTTGWALVGTDGSISSGRISLKQDRWQGGGMRYLRFKHWLSEIQQQSNGINQVFFEEVRRHLGTDAAHIYGGFMAMLTAWCEHQKLPYEGVPVGTINRFITGKGNANKRAVIDAVRNLGHQPNDDNEADALALLHWAMENRMGSG